MSVGWRSVLGVWCGVVWCDVVKKDGHNLV